MTAGRPVGNHIRAICTILESIGPSGSRALCTHYPMSASVMGKYLSRAVGMGLVSVVHGKRNVAHYSVFTVVPGWAEMVCTRKTTKLKPIPVPKPKQSKWQGVSSVFAMGGL